MLLKGNCLELLAEMPDNSVDSIVTDPPYELGFMGKSWDNSGIAYNVELWSQALRVLKPGGHLLAFGGSRTYHRLACAVEDAGFEVRDQIMWIYGSGFPKSYNVAKGIEGTLVNGSASWNDFHKLNGTLTESNGANANGLVKGNAVQGNRPAEYESHGSLELDPTTEEAKKWQGWGTALKPAHEPIVVARKPLIGTVATNVLTYGTGALNIDGSRVGTTDALGRWPANVIHDGSEEVLEGFPNTKSGGGDRTGAQTGELFTGLGNTGKPRIFKSSEGSAARFFYCAKASKSERNAGLEGLPEKGKVFNGQNAEPSGNAEGSVEDKFSTKPSQNFHPTVKPIALMRYLVKLVTPPNGTVLDPFLGSGTTAVAAILESFNWVGCEMTEDYWPIIEARVAWAEAQPKTLL